MALIRINPTKILVGGDKKAAMTFAGPARSQLEILKQGMSFQNLSQGIRRVWLNENVYIECRKIFNYQECRVWVRPAPVIEVEKQIVRYFLVVFATGSGNEAVVWDMVSDTVFMGINPETEINYTLAELQTSFEDAGLPAFIEAEYPSTDSHEWFITYPSDRYDTPLILPDYLYGWFAQAGYYYVFSHLYPASGYTARPDGLVRSVQWDFDYIDESPLPHPNKEVLSDTATQEEDVEQASYITFFQGSVNDESPLVSEFEPLTGLPWPEDAERVFRLFQYWHPFFWYTIKDSSGDLAVLSAEGKGILLVDSWRDGEWADMGDGADLVKDSLTWHNAGIAAIAETDEAVPLEDPQVLLFEYVSVCHKFEDTYGTGMCDKALSDFDEYFRIYEHGKIPLRGMVKQILDLTNIERVAQGKHELVFNSVLSESAQRHARDQAALVAASGTEGITDGHTGTDGTLPSERAFDAGYFTWIEDDVENVKNETTVWAWKVSENVAWTWDPSPAERVIQLWKSSTQGHWENMIDEDLVEMGVGIASMSGGGYIIVQNFGKVDHRYPGFSPFNTDELKNYVDTNFLFDPVHEDTRQPRMYLLGSVELNNDEFYRLTGRMQE